MLPNNNDIGIIGLHRVYNGQPKKIQLVNNGNRKTTIKYYDQDDNILEDGPIEIGEYKVIIQTENIKITKKLVIQNRSDLKIDQVIEQLSSESNFISSNEESEYESEDSVVETSEEEEKEIETNKINDNNLKEILNELEEPKKSQSISSTLEKSVPSSNVEESYLSMAIDAIYDTNKPIIKQPQLIFGLAAITAFFYRK